MTVCVVAIANNGMIFGASDRMLSTAEIAFEPQNPKAWTFTTAIKGFWSGDASLLAEILGAVRRDLQNLLGQEPAPDWFDVKDVVDLFVAHRNRVKRNRAEAELLAPLGLNMQSFLDSQNTLDPTVTEKLTNAIIAYGLPYTVCIIAGIDHSGSHIWVVEDGVPRCEDSAAFAAIGAGARHALSQMMIGGHSQVRTPSETLVLVHMAKKRAEVAPSVGSATDIAIIGPEMGQHGPLSAEHLARLDEDYDALLKIEVEGLRKAVAEFDQFLAERIAQQASDPQVSDGDED